MTPEDEPKGGGQQEPPSSLEELAEDEDFQLSASWVGVDELDAPATNQFLSQFYEDTFFVTFGTLIPPALIGGAKEKVEQARMMDYIPIRPVARIALTPARMRELIQVLQTNLERYENRQSEEGGGEE